MSTYFHEAMSSYRLKVLSIPSFLLQRTCLHFVRRQMQHCTEDYHILQRPSALNCRKAMKILLSGDKKIIPRDYHFPESNRTLLSSGQCNTNIKAKRNQEEWRVIITVYLYSRHKIIVLEQLFGGHHNIIIYYLMALQNINARCPREHNWTGAKRIQLYWGQENTIVLGPREHNCSGPREHNCTENTIVLGPREHNWTGAKRTQFNWGQ